MTESNKQTLTLQRGFTLVELSISMVLIVSLMLAGFYIIKRIRIDAAVNATIASANLSMNKANAAFAGTDNTFGANTTTLYAMNVWPKERVVTATNASGDTSVVSVKGQFSGSEEMMWTDGGNSSPAYSGFIYYFKNIPSEACLPLIKNLSMHPNARTSLLSTLAPCRPHRMSRQGVAVCHWVLLPPNASRVTGSTSRFNSTNLEAIHLTRVDVEPQHGVDSLAVVFFRMASPSALKHLKTSPSHTK
jgi:prepilin-type N-terminal cleavage/methylation domain-containing protein